MGMFDKAKAKITEQSPVRHLVRYNYMGRQVTEQFDSVGEMNNALKKIKKMDGVTNARTEITTKKK